MHDFAVPIPAVVAGLLPGLGGMRIRSAIGKVLLSTAIFAAGAVSSESHQFGLLVGIVAPGEVVHGSPMSITITMENADRPYSDDWFFSYRCIIAKWPQVTLENPSWPQLQDQVQEGSSFAPNPQVFTFALDPAQLPVLPGNYSLEVHARIAWYEQWYYGGLPAQPSGGAYETETSPRKVKFTMTGDFTKPVLTILSPAANAAVSNSAVTVRGTVTDLGGLARVEYQSGTNAFSAVEQNGTNWSFTTEVEPGLTTFRVRAVDVAGNETVASRTIKRVVPSPVGLLVVGDGVVRPFTNGQVLVLGDNYTITATPRPGNLFSNWIVGDIFTNTPTLHFTMASNLMITANFVTNHFLSTAGVYNGLFYEPDGVQQHSAGFFTLSLTPKGRFSGKISLDGGTHSFTGGFDLAGQAQVQTARSRKTALVVQLYLDSVNREIRGYVTDGDWLAEMSADRVFSSSANQSKPYAPGYTMVIPGGGATDTGFVGDGYATLWIDYYGTIRMSGALADNTRINRSLRISEKGQWPLYVPLYGGKGSIMSWMTFSNQPAGGLGGDLIWIKPAMQASRFYPAGLTNVTSVCGYSFWGPGPSNGRLHLNFTNGVLILAGGNLPVTLTNNLDNSSTVTSPSRINMKWDLITGLVSGYFVHPATGRSTRLQGVILQNQSIARGYFLGTNQSGAFELRW